MKHMKTMKEKLVLLGLDPRIQGRLKLIFNNEPHELHEWKKESHSVGLQFWLVRNPGPVIAREPCSEAILSRPLRDYFKKNQALFYNGICYK